ncbi:energy-coupling factor transporter ATPase [Aerococcaceae bacterium DSM 111176]|nr:energy-coupling factor transporter ATPase [Aerococcaceae bacterium DSM 111176]
MMIELKQVSYQYPHSNPEANTLSAINLTIKNGEWVTLLGSNGSGKSTLVKTFNGLIQPDSGEIIINDTLLTSETIHHVRRQIGMVFQNPDNQFVGSTVESDIAFGLENIGMDHTKMHQRVEEVLRFVGLWDLRHNPPESLSGGQKQRTAIASALVSSPQILVLDEATSMLDPEGRKHIMTLIQRIRQEQNLTIVAITHNIEESLLSDRIILMHQGEILQSGTPEEIFYQKDLLFEIGLDIPIYEKINHQLKELGINTPGHLITRESLMNWLWTFN